MRKSYREAKLELRRKKFIQMKASYEQLFDTIVDYHSKVDNIFCATFQIVFAILHQANDEE